MEKDTFDSQLTDQATSDYNRGRMYLSDYATREGVPVFQNIADALQHAIQIIQSPRWLDTRSALLLFFLSLRVSPGWIDTRIRRLIYFYSVPDHFNPFTCRSRPTKRRNICRSSVLSFVTIFIERRAAQNAGLLSSLLRRRNCLVGLKLTAESGVSRLWRCRDFFFTRSRRQRTRVLVPFLFFFWRLGANLTIRENSFRPEFGVSFVRDTRLLTCRIHQRLFRGFAINCPWERQKTLGNQFTLFIISIIHRERSLWN